MTFTIPSYEKGHICDMVGSLCEAICYTVCKWPAEYKDPDDCRKAHCDTCPLFEMGDRIKDEVDSL